LRCFAGGWPRAFCSSVVDAAAASCCSDSTAHHADGWLRPTNAAKPLFHASSGVVAVQRGDMRVPGGHREQRWQQTQRGARNRGAVVLVVVSRCSRSLAASVAYRPPPRRYGNAAVQHLPAVDDVRLGEEYNTRARHT